jgi:protein disulfide-isomerase A6
MVLTCFLLNGSLQFAQHCQRMAPEYSKAALGLHPLLPFYAVDCDEEKNKRLCAEQGVKGFPTVKVNKRPSALLLRRC